MTLRTENLQSDIILNKINSTKDKRIIKVKKVNLRMTEKTVNLGMAGKATKRIEIELKLYLSI